MTQETIKWVFNFDKETKEFINREQAEENQLQAGDFFLPASATFIEPPRAGKNQKQVFDEKNNKWDLVADYRGLVYWDSDGDKHQIKKLGINPPAGARFTEPPPVFKVEERKEELTNLIDTTINSLNSDIGNLFTQNFMFFTYAEMPNAENNVMLKNIATIKKITVQALITQLKARKAGFEKALTDASAIRAETINEIASIVSENAAQEVQNRFDYKIKQVRENLEKLKD